MNDAELQEIRQGVERCEARHVGREHPFCENYGCMSMRQLLDELDRLRDASWSVVRSSFPDKHEIWTHQERVLLDVLE